MKVSIATSTLFFLTLLFPATAEKNLRSPKERRLFDIDCSVTWHLFNSQTDDFVADLTPGIRIARPPPCGYTNIEASVSCIYTDDTYKDDYIGIDDYSYDASDYGYEYNGEVIIELFQGPHLIKRRKETDYPYFLFGNRGTSISNGKIKAGRYGIRAYANGVWSPFTNFTLGGTCA